MSEAKATQRRGTAPGNAKKLKGITGLACPSSDTQRMAMVILEVLAGVRTPTDAAQAIGLSLMRYYQLEMRALEGLVRALEPRPRGKQPSSEVRIRQLEKQLQRAEREAARHQALARIAQRSLGLKAPATPPAKPAGAKRRQRRPAARALKAVRALQKNVAEPAAAAVQTSTAAAPQVAAPARQQVPLQGGTPHDARG